MKLSNYVSLLNKRLANIAPQFGLVIAGIVSLVITVITGSWVSWPITVSLFPIIGVIYQWYYFEHHKS